MTTVIGHGVYSFTEAARLTGLKPSRIREWFRGRLRGPGRKPVFLGDYPPIDGDLALSFHDLIDVFVAGQLRDHGVALQTLRRVYETMKKELQTCHPFCRKELLSDGKIVFMRGLDSQGQEALTEILTRQQIFPQILLPFLRKIDYDRLSVLARRWRIADQIVVDPTICLGKPVVEEVGIATEVLAAAYHANAQDADLVADWFNVQPAHVRAAADFEDSSAA